MHFLWWWMYSIGSSIVMMWWLLSVLILLMIDASVLNKVLEQTTTLAEVFRVSAKDD